MTQNPSPIDPHAEALLNVMLACRHLPDLVGQMTVLIKAWLVVACDAKHQHLFTQGGFEAERQRQLAELERIARIVRDEEPDLAYHFLLNDHAGYDRLLEYLSRRRDELSRGAPHANPDE